MPFRFEEQYESDLRNSLERATAFSSPAAMTPASSRRPRRHLLTSVPPSWPNSCCMKTSTAGVGSPPLWSAWACYCWWS